MLKIMIPFYDSDLKDKIKNNLKQPSDWTRINGLNVPSYFVRVFTEVYRFQIRYLFYNGDTPLEVGYNNGVDVGIIPILDNSVYDFEKHKYYYPTDIVDWSADLKFNLMKNNLEKVGFITINGSTNGKFKPVKSYVYSFDNNLYVFTKNLRKGDYITKDDILIQEGEKVWLKLEPIKWIKLNDRFYAADRIIMSGIPVDYVQKYLNNYFSKEIFQFCDPFENNKDIIGTNIESFIKKPIPDEVLNDVEEIMEDEIKSFIDESIDDEPIDDEEDTFEDEIEDLFESSDDKKQNKKNKIREIKNAKVLNDKKFLTSPTIGRELELEKLMINLAQDLKLPILVGESGVGKTAIIDELVYRIQNNMVPKFLKDKTIIEVNPNYLVAGTKYRGEFEEKLIEVIEACIDNDAIMFIDEIHTMYKTGSSEQDPNDMAAIVKNYIDRDNLKVIGTTTEEEYNKYFVNDAMKRRFSKIIIKEPDNQVLYQIIEKVINDCSNKTNISSEKILTEYKQLINVIIELTKNKNRTYDDIVNNPDLSIGIIDTAFGYAKYFDSDELTLEHFIKSIMINDRLYNTAKEKAIDDINNLEPIKKSYQKLIKFKVN